MKNIIVGNWKLNKTLSEVAEWVDGMKLSLKNTDFEDKLDVVICPPYPYLLGMVDLLEGTGIKVGAQDVSQFEEGTYTGEVSAKILSEIVDYVIIGHSERRNYFAEDLKIMKRKMDKAFAYKITPIVCFSDKVWEDGLPSPKFNEKFFIHQVKFLVKDLKPSEKNKIVWGYEPPSAISKQKHEKGFGQAQNVNKVVEAISLVKKYTERARIIYGGSANADNIMTYLNQDVIDGVLPGSASLHAQDFSGMVKAVVEANNGAR